MVYTSFNCEKRVDFLRCVLTLLVGIIFGFSFGFLLINVVSRESPVILTCSSCTQNSSECEDFKRGRTVAAMLAQEIRVLCWIDTKPENYNTYAKTVKDTWGQRCNILLFMSSTEDSLLPSINLAVTENNQAKWGKTKKAFKFIYDNYLDKADWFLKAEDDTFMIVENVRYMLKSHSPFEPVYFGRKFTEYVQQDYTTGGAGYVLSKESLKRLVEVGLPDKDKCREDDYGPEDSELGLCLSNVGVKVGDSKDDYGRGRFFPFIPERHLFPELMREDDWYWYYTNQTEEVNDCCSDTAISFHDIYPEIMLVLDYLIYQLHPYGVTFRD